MAQNRKAARSGVNKNMNVFYGALVVIAVAGIAAILFARSRSAAMSTEPLDMSQIANAEELIGKAEGVSIGDENAPVKILVFSDYMCPACGVWAGQVEPLIKRDFVETGKVRLTYHDFPLHPGHRHSFIAARAARCAQDQRKFWEYHDQLFAAQQQWIYGAAVPMENFTEYARALGLDMNEFEDCVRSEQHAELVTANKLLGEQLGVGSTPTVFLNGRQMATEWNDYSAMKAAIEAAGGA